MKSVVAADGKVKIIYKDLPILGEASKVAALAALASVKQGKHTALHNALMEFSGKLDRDKILEIAGSVGIDRAQLEKDMEDPKLKRIIERNMAAGERARHPRHAGLRDRQAVRARRRRRRGAEAADRRRPQELARQGCREPEQAHRSAPGFIRGLNPSMSIGGCGLASMVSVPPRSTNRATVSSSLVMSSEISTSAGW